MLEHIRLAGVTWTSPSLASFEAMVAAIEARFGPPAAHDLDSNGVGLFDAYALRFACGLEVVLWRFHAGAQMQPIDPAVEPSTFEIHSNQRDLEHIACHLQLAVTSTSDAVAAPRTFVVMRADDNGNEVPVKFVTSRCEAERLVHEYESRGHKQIYWVSDVAGSGA